MKIHNGPALLNNDICEDVPRQKPASFSIDQVMEKLQTGGGSK